MLKILHFICTPKGPYCLTIVTLCCFLHTLCVYTQVSTRVGGAGSDADVPDAIRFTIHIKIPDINISFNMMTLIALQADIMTLCELRVLCLDLQLQLCVCKKILTRHWCSAHTLWTAELSLVTQTNVEANTDGLSGLRVVWTQGVRVSAVLLPFIADLARMTQGPGAGAVAGGGRDAGVSPRTRRNTRPALTLLTLRTLLELTDVPR